MSFEVYEGDLPKGVRPGRGISEETQEVLDALTESAKTGKPVQFSWILPDLDEVEKEKSRIRGIAWKNGFSCSLFHRGQKIILKASVKPNGDSEAAELVATAKEAEVHEVKAAPTPPKKAPAKKATTRKVAA